MRLKNNIDYKRFPEPCRGYKGRFTILVLSASKPTLTRRLFRVEAETAMIPLHPQGKGEGSPYAALRLFPLSAFGLRRRGPPGLTRAQWRLLSTIEMEKGSQETKNCDKKIVARRRATFGEGLIVIRVLVS